MPEKNDAVFPKTDLISRSAKRQYERELANVQESFDEINDSFINHLFDEHSPYDYLHLYCIHLDWWIATCKWYIRHACLNYVVIDTDWFANNYKPLEIPKQSWDY
jgi:hypothetical protein